MKSKVCTVCKNDRPISLFNLRGGREKGYRSFCKDCESKKSAARYTPEKRKEKYLSNLEKERQDRREYYQRNKEAYYVRKAKRRASTLQATPSWYDEFDDFVLKEAYDLCKLRENTFGFPFEVDHVLPLQGDYVCGLHWHKNWAVIPRQENRAKGNKI